MEYFAPNNGRFITARLNSAYPAWVFLDAFELVCPSQFSLGRDTTLCSVEGYPLSVSVAYDEYEWQNGATSSSITAEEPGWYWVEANSTFCSFRDSIYLQEFDYSCDCAIYQDNAFSPNFDGINDQFRLPSACNYSEYLLQVSDRWGNIVFWTDDPLEGWDGRWRGESTPAGVYWYTLVYQFGYQSERSQLSGDILVFY